MFAQIFIILKESAVTQTSRLADVLFSFLSAAAELPGAEAAVWAHCATPG